MSVFKSQDIAKKAHFYSERDSEKRMERLHFHLDSIRVLSLNGGMMFT